MSNSCLDGMSLTVVDTGKDFFEVHIIPHTLKNTNLEHKKINDFINIEYDILSKYVEKHLHPEKKSKINSSFLNEHGFI